MNGVRAVGERRCHPGLPASPSTRQSSPLALVAFFMPLQPPAGGRRAPRSAAGAGPSSPSTQPVPLGSFSFMYCVICFKDISALNFSCKHRRRAPSPAEEKAVGGHRGVRVGPQRRTRVRARAVQGVGVEVSRERPVGICDPAVPPTEAAEGRARPGDHACGSERASPTFVSRHVVFSSSPAGERRRLQCACAACRGAAARPPPWPPRGAGSAGAQTCLLHNFTPIRPLRPLKAFFSLGATLPTLGPTCSPAPGPQST